MPAQQTHTHLLNGGGCTVIIADIQSLMERSGSWLGCAIVSASRGGSGIGQGRNGAGTCVLNLVKMVIDIMRDIESREHACVKTRNL